MTHPTLTKAEIAAPRVEPKWTRLNDEWVQVHCEILQGANGRYDRPVTDLNSPKGTIQTGEK